MTLSVNDKLKIVRNALTAVSTNVYHYRRPDNLENAIVWAEDAEDNSFYANNIKQNIAMHGTIDYFTKSEYDRKIDDIVAGLNSSSRIAWNIKSVQYEDETGLIHYEWEFIVS